MAGPVATKTRLDAVRDFIWDVAPDGVEAAFVVLIIGGTVALEAARWLGRVGR
jgi:hypothetical protein